MDDARKLQFIANMTSHALNHTASTPNVVTPDGKMSHDKKLAFVQAMTKHGLQHLDSGGIAGALNPILGTGNNFQASGAGITSGTNQSQIGSAYQSANNALNQQQQIVGAVAPGATQGANAQAALSGQLAAEANGQGPNPAQAQYNQNIQNIASQQAGAVAGTKGISPALAAKLAQQGGSAAMQNAAGTAATTEAQQTLAAQSNLANLSAQQVAQGQTAVQGINNASQNEQNILQGANTAANNAAVGMQSNINNVNSNTAIANQNTNTGLVGGLLSGAGSATGLFARGGAVKKMASGGIAAPAVSGPQSSVGQWLSSNTSSSGPTIQATQPIQSNPWQSPKIGKSTTPVQPTEDNNSPIGANMPGDPSTYTSSNFGADLMNMHGNGGVDPTSADYASQVMAAPSGMANGGLMKSGGKVNPHNAKQKAVVSGDSLKNDKIPTMLSEGEEVIDRDTLADPGPIGQMARAVAAHINKKNKMKGKQ